MRFTYALIGLGVLLIALAVVFFIRRDRLAEEAYGLEREREQLTIERRPEDRERLLRVLDQSSRLNSDARTAGLVSIACLVLGLGATSVGLLRIRKHRRAAPTAGMGG